MKTYNISRLPSMLCIGYDGENNWRPQAFDVSPLLQNHPDGTITLWLLPEGETQAFPVALTRDGNTVVWTPLSEEMTARTGALQIVCTDGTDVGKSRVALFRVDSSILPGADHPAAVPSWATQTVERAEAAADRAEEAADSIDIEALEARIAQAVEDYLEEQIQNAVNDYLEDVVIDDSVVAGAVDEWLDAHPEATTTVQDRSLTEAKFSDELKLKTIKDYVTPEMFGAKGDGVTDDTQAWKDAINSGEIIVAFNAYKCTEPLTLNNNVYIYGIVYNEVSDGFIVSGQLNKEYVLRVSAKSDKDAEHTGIKVVDCNKCHFDLSSEYFHTGVTFVGDAQGCAYNSVNSIFCKNSKYFLLLQAKNAGWVNENYFYNGRFVGNTGSKYKGADYGITVDSPTRTHEPNANSFINFCAEGSYCAVKLSNCRNNKIENIRTEQCTYSADCSAYTYNNIIYVSYGMNGIIDNGFNLIFDAEGKVKSSIDKTVADSESLYNNTASNASGSTAKRLFNVKVTDSTISKNTQINNTVSVQSGLKSTGHSSFGFLVNVKDNHTLKLCVNCTGPYRVVVIPFDQEGNFVDEADNLEEFGDMFQYNNSYVGKIYGSGISTVDTVREKNIKVDSRAHTVFIGVWLPEADTIVHRVRVFGDGTNFETDPKGELTLSSIPTADGYYINQEVCSSEETKKWVWNGTSWSEVQTTQ